MATVALAAVLIMSCKNPVASTASKKPTANITIKLGELAKTGEIAGSINRTVQSVKNPVFDGGFDLTLQKEGETEMPVADTTGIDGAGVKVSLSDGKWTIRLKAYRFVSGQRVLAAKGSKTVNVTPSPQTIVIDLEPLAMNDPDAGLGVLNYTITLPASPESLASASLYLKDSNGNPVNGYNPLDLTQAGNLSGSIDIAPGFYDLRVILTKNGQSTGDFTSVHIYSGLPSNAEIDLSEAIFDDKVYIMGTLGGVRLGTLGLSLNASGSNPFKTLELGGIESINNGAKRSTIWTTDIPSSYIGQNIYAVQEFNGEKDVKLITALPEYGVTDVALTLIPSDTDFIDVAPWYSQLTVSGGNHPEYAANGSAGDYWQSAPDNGSVWLELDFGFNVTVSAADLVFNGNFADVYNLAYQNGSNWENVVYNYRNATNSAYRDFFTAVTASKFKWQVPSIGGNAPALNFSLYKAADRGDLAAAIAAAEDNYTSATGSQGGYIVEDGDVKQAYEDAIAAAQDVCNDISSTDQEIAEAIDALERTGADFDAAKTLPGDVKYIFKGPKDETITLSEGNTLSWMNNETLHITVVETFASYEWYVDGTKINGEDDNNITLYARNYSLGTHTVTLKVTKGGIPYTKSLIFAVN